MDTETTNQTKEDAMKIDRWVPACGGTELPFTTRTGKRLHYLFNQTTGEHAYYDVRADLFLTNDEAFAALAKY